MLSNPSLDQLRVLVTIADTGSFSAAGRHLSRVQSASSQTVATLEEQQWDGYCRPMLSLGLALWSGCGSSPTADGRMPPTPTRPAASGSCAASPARPCGSR
ncbi:LysR family transcriptional regulator [Cystobacter fuscus]|uniref:LysR family transcriptional regulator n=1 Tax=Cystobacter fuscus TaxID=43 RepID=UPI0037C14A9F